MRTYMIIVLIIALAAIGISSRRCSVAQSTTLPPHRVIHVAPGQTWIASVWKDSTTVTLSIPRTGQPKPIFCLPVIQVPPSDTKSVTIVEQ